MAKAKKSVPFEQLTAADGERKVDANSTGSATVPTFDPLKNNPYGKHKSVYEICGMKESVYRTNEPAKYEAFLREMNMADLQNHSYEMGLLPTDNRGLMLDKLMREFRIKNSAYSGATIPQNSFEHIKNDPVLAKKVADILSQAR